MVCARTAQIVPKEEQTEVDQLVSEINEIGAIFGSDEVRAMMVFLQGMKFQKLLTESSVGA